MIDWSRVKELHDEIGPDAFGEVVGLFLEEADEAVAQLPNCTDARSIESALHFLKGSALNLGFRVLAQLCQTGERQAAAGDTGVDLGAIVVSYTLSRDAFAQGTATMLDDNAV